MTDALARLIQYPANPVFDDSPLPALALRVRHSAGLTIVVAGAVLRLTSDAVTREYALDDYTIGTLADRLVADGYDVVFENAEYSGRSARSLLAKSSSQDDSNGDHLHVYTSLLWGLFDSYGVQLDHAEYEVGEALRQMVFTQSEEFWLDVWAGLYGVPRADGEDDAALHARLPAEVFRLRNNPRAIERAVLALTGKTVEIREPWQRMFALDSSALSGGDALHDADYFTYHVIQPVARAGIDWSDVLTVISRNKPAGVVMYAPAVEFPVAHASVAEAGEYSVLSGIDELIACGAWPGGAAPLGVMRLDDNDIVLNHLAMVYQLRSMSNVTGLGLTGYGADTLNLDFVLNKSRLALAPEKIIGIRSVPMAAIALSDGAALGDENAILCRGVEYFSIQPPPTLSDELALSDYGQVRDARAVEFVTLNSITSWNEYPTAEVVASDRQTSESMMRAGVYRITPAGWGGGTWDDTTWAGEGVVMGMAISVERTTPGDVLNINLWLNTSIIS